jgi:hypothetical protein
MKYVIVIVFFWSFLGLAFGTDYLDKNNLNTRQIIFISFICGPVFWLLNLVLATIGGFDFVMSYIINKLK